MQHIGTIQLPAWFEPPRPLTKSRQGSLFESWLHRELVPLRVSTDEATRWWEKGWISFDPSRDCEVSQFDDPKLHEIALVRDVVRSGLADKQIEWLLSQLDSPFTVDPSRIAYSFQFGWVMATLAEPDDVMEEKLSAWLEVCDLEELVEIRENIEGIIEARSTEHSQPSE